MNDEYDRLTGNKLKIIAILSMHNQKIPIEDLDRKNEPQLLAETLNWIENNTEAELQEFVASCRSKFEELINYY